MKLLIILKRIGVVLILKKYRKKINDIIEAISKFKKTCLEPTLANVNAQVDAYKIHEEVG